MAKFPEISPEISLKQPGRHVNAASRKSLEIQAWPIAKPRTHSEQKIV